PVARPETMSRPSVCRLCGTKTKTASAKPSHIATPPRRGVGFAWACRPPGWATTPKRRDSTAAKGTATALTINAKMNGHKPGRRCSVRPASAASLKKSVKPGRDRELPAQLEGALVDRVEGRRVVDALDQVGDAVRDD